MASVSVPIPTSTFIELIDFLRQKNSPRDPPEVIESAIDYWMQNANWKNEIICPASLARGYSWKSDFLPTGTTLRIRYNSEYHYAKIEGDKLLHDGKSVSPNQFAMAVAGCARNAWRDVWVKRPSDNDFVVADSLRSKSA